MKIVLLPAVCWWSLFAVSGFAQATPQSIADAELPSLLTIYKDIHSHPELSTQEQRTAPIIAKELRAAGCEVTEDFGKYRSEEHTSELQSPMYLVCRLLLEKKKKK